jgi:hypothetical protein
MPNLPNPAAQLGAIVSQLYALAGNSGVAAAQRQTLLLQAHDLRGDLVALVSLQFTNATAAYTGAMAALAGVTTAINQAEQDIQKIVNVVTGAAQLATSIDNLLQEAAKIATTVAA